MDAFARLLAAKAAPLSALCLSGNRLGARGGRMLADALKHNSCLQQLDVSHAGLGDEGAAHLALTLLENDTLLDLDLAANQVRWSP
jgi:Ran GTPase-activating protein (RanGAP) involved in mRNA processing and transport